jgi:hypothetical protein
VRQWFFSDATVAVIGGHSRSPFLEECMVRIVAGALLSLIVAASAAAQTATCNPYELTCPSGPLGPGFNPYDPTRPQGPYVGLGPYAPPADRLDGAFARWILNGDLFLDTGANTFGWVILDNLSSEAQEAIIEYTSEGWASPAYRVVPLAPKVRKPIGLHENPLLRGTYFSVHVYFQKAGAVHATFRPHAADTIGQHDVPGAQLADTCGTH